MCPEGESDNQYISELESDHVGYYSTETETESEPECEFEEGMDAKGRGGNRQIVGNDIHRCRSSSENTLYPCLSYKLCAS